MRFKTWVILFIVFNILTYISIEVLYNIYKTDYRHNVDYLVKKIIPSLQNVDKEIIILGDSVANGAFKNLILNDNILDLTSNRAIAIAGNYFLLKRYLEHNQAPKKLYLFAIPEFFNNDLNEPYTYLFFETVFTKEDEIKEIKKIKPTLYSSKNIIDKYFERRSKALFNKEVYVPTQRSKFVNVNESEILNNFEISNKGINNRIDSYKKTLNHFEKLTNVYLNKFKELCAKEKIEFYIVLEPMPLEMQQLFYESKTYNYLVSHSYNLIDVNKLYRFGNNHFLHDSVHFSGKANQYFQKVIDKKIIDIFKDDI